MKKNETYILYIFFVFILCIFQFKYSLAADKNNINLNYLPTKPVNYSDNLIENKKENEISVKLDFKNSELDISKYFIEWRVELDIGGNNWIDITNRIEDKSINKGYELDIFKFNLNLNKEEFSEIENGGLLNIKVILINSIDKSNTFNKNIEIKFYDYRDRIYFYEVREIDGDIVPIKEICVFFKGEHNNCEALRGQLLKAESEIEKSTLYWQINGVEYRCNEDFKRECNEDSIIFRAIKSKNSLELRYTSEGGVNTVNGFLNLVDPEIEIDLINKDQLISEKSNEYIIEKGAGLELKINLKPSWLREDLDFIWKANGEVIVNKEDNEKLSLSDSSIDYYYIEIEGLSKDDSIYLKDDLKIRLIDSNSNKDIFLKETFSKLPQKVIITLQVLLGVLIIYLIFKYLFPIIHKFILKK